MSCWRSLTALVVLSLLPGAAPAQSPLAPDQLLDSVAVSLRTCLLETLPPVLYETSPGWGKTARVADGFKWRGQGLRVRPEVRYVYQNDGAWRRLRLRPADLPQTLVVRLSNWQQPGPGPATFDAFLSFDLWVEYERQQWDGGNRLYAGSTRARLRVKLALKCEMTSRVEAAGGLLPDMVFRLRVVQAQLGYEGLHFQHVAGLGGEAAQLLGDTARGALRLFRPDLERELLEKANAAIVKAADTRDVRLSLGRLVK